MGYKVYVFGNSNIGLDNKPFLYHPQLCEDFSNVEFIKVNINADLPIENEDTIFIIDTIEGISDYTVLDEVSIDRLACSVNTSVHDYDLGFQPKYLKKLGRIKSVRIFGIPMKGEPDYDSFHSSFKKFVAHDMQGS